MLRDWCTWDKDYNDLVQRIRGQLVDLATGAQASDYTSVLMQGSGTFAVEACLGTGVSPNDKLLILTNGAYGQRMVEIANRLQLKTRVLDSGELATPDPQQVAIALDQDHAIRQVALVHCETTTGILNPLAAIAKAVKQRGRGLIVDAMSSFGGIPMDIASLDIDWLISSANKCIQGVPGFSFVLVRRSQIEQCAGAARSLSLDLFDQWQTMEQQAGKWRFTSPTHAVHAFATALEELHAEGGVEARYQRYCSNQRRLVRGLRRLGFETLLPDALQSPIITAVINPQARGYSFERFYTALKTQGFVIYPGKVSVADTFRIGSIGDVHADDIDRLLHVIDEIRFWN